MGTTMKAALNLIAIAVCLCVLLEATGCSGTQPSNDPSANLNITNVSVQGVGRSGGGFNYTFTPTVAETRGGTATVTAIDASVSSDSTILASGRYTSADFGSVGIP